MIMYNIKYTLAQSTTEIDADSLRKVIKAWDDLQRPVQDNTDDS